MVWVWMLVTQCGDSHASLPKSLDGHRNTIYHPWPICVPLASGIHGHEKDQGTNRHSWILSIVKLHVNITFYAQTLSASKGEGWEQKILAP